MLILRSENVGNFHRMQEIGKAVGAYGAGCNVILPPRFFLRPSLQNGIIGARFLCIPDVEEGGFNMIFYYVGDGNFYGIHAENCPIPVFRFRKESGECVYDQLGDRDTHDYYEEEILYMIPCDESVWDTVKIDGKSLEEILQDSYIVNIS